MLEQTWSRPTCEINGMIGGYTGDGFKTVIPAKASAKISFRLVANQDPEKIREAFRAHVRARIPADCSVEFIEHGGSRAIAVPTDGKFLQQARAALADEWGRQALLRASGGSIPVAGDFKRILGLDALLIGFALPDDRIHSPNEKYDLKSYAQGHPLVDPHPRFVRALIPERRLPRGAPARGGGRKSKRPACAGLELIAPSGGSALTGLVALVDLVDDVDTAAPTHQLVGAMTAHQGLERIADFHRATF